jgi:hypothetical protein
MPSRPDFDTIATLVTLDALTRRVILYLRLLRTSPAGRREVEQDLVARAGPGSEHSLEHLERLEDLVARALDRPLDIGSVEDGRATGDEMVVAQLVVAAVEGSSGACRLQASRLAAQSDCEPLARSADLAAGLFTVGSAARCSCGRTSDDLDHNDDEDAGR